MPNGWLAFKHFVTVVVSKSPFGSYDVSYPRDSFLMLKTKGFYNINNGFTIHEVTIV